jgi:hypothetical protein
MRFYWLIVGTFSVWRVTHLLVAEAGPWQLLVRLRRRAGAGCFAALFGCFYCMSLWIAMPVACLIGEAWKERILLWFALSGGAIFLERATTRSNMPPPASYDEEMEEDDGVLRKE